MEKREEYVNKIRSHIDEWEHKLDAVKAKAKEDVDNTKADYEKVSRELEEILNKSKEELKKAKDASQEKWDEIGRSMVDSWEKSKITANELVSKLDSSKR